LTFNGEPLHSEELPSTEANKGGFADQNYPNNPSYSFEKDFANWISPEYFGTQRESSSRPTEEEHVESISPEKFGNRSKRKNTGIHEDNKEKKRKNPAGCETVTYTKKCENDNQPTIKDIIANLRLIRREEEAHFNKNTILRKNNRDINDELTYFFKKIREIITSPHSKKFPANDKNTILKPLQETLDRLLTYKNKLHDTISNQDSFDTYRKKNAYNLAAKKSNVQTYKTCCEKINVKLIFPLQELITSMNPSSELGSQQTEFESTIPQFSNIILPNF
jgi:hypothetical protein